MFGTKALAIAIALFQGSAYAYCGNNATFTAISYTDDGNPSKNCKQIRQKEERRQAMCPKADVNAQCPHTCGSCCEDDPSYTFHLKRQTDTIVDCTWILKNSKKKEIRFNEYCTKNNTQGKLHSVNGRSVRDACSLSCDYCFTGALQITTAPTPAPSAAPTPVPTVDPLADDGSPSDQPTRPPSPMPSPFPSMKPSLNPSDSPSLKPSDKPSDSPSLKPSDKPSDSPSLVPSDAPSLKPSDVPSDAPSLVPSDSPSLAPSDIPSDSPSLAPSDDPSSAPSLAPSDSPSLAPSDDPSDTPTTTPTQSLKPSATPSAKPSGFNPTPAPTPAPSPAPTSGPTSCVDGTGTFALDFDGTLKTCSYFSANQNASKNQARKDKYCGRDAVRSLCPSSCGYCASTCADDATFTFKLLFDTTGATVKPCSWLLAHTKDSVDTKRKDAYCTEAFVNMSDNKGIVNYKCPVSCGKCAAV